MEITIVIIIIVIIITFVASIVIIIIVTIIIIMIRIFSLICVKPRVDNEGPSREESVIHDSVKLGIQGHTLDVAADYDNIDDDDDDDDDDDVDDNDDDELDSLRYEASSGSILWSVRGSHSAD